MEIESLRKSFTQKQINKLALLKANYKAEQQILQIEEEISYILGSKEACRISTYGIYAYGINPHISKEEKWNLLEEQANPIPRPLTNIDEPEIKRLHQSYTRIRILHALGFEFEDKNSSRPVVSWGKEERAGDVLFQVAQAPKEKNIFLVRTILFSEEQGASIVSENLVAAPTERNLNLYLQNLVQTQNPLESVFKNQ